MTLYIILALFSSLTLASEPPQNAITVVNDIIDRSTGFSFSSLLDIKEENRGIERQIVKANIDVNLIESDTLEVLSTIEFIYPEEMKGAIFFEYTYIRGETKRILQFPNEKSKDITNDAFYGKLSLSFDYFKKNIVDCDNTIALIKEHEKSIIIESICNNLIDDNLVQRRLIKFNYSTDTMTYIKEYNKIGDVVRKVSFVDYRVNNLKVFPLEIQIDEPRKRKKTKFKFTEFEFINNK